MKKIIIVLLAFGILGCDSPLTNASNRDGIYYYFYYDCANLKISTNIYAASIQTKHDDAIKSKSKTTFRSEYNEKPIHIIGWEYELKTGNYNIGVELYDLESNIIGMGELEYSISSHTQDEISYLYLTTQLGETVPIPFYYGTGRAPEHLSSPPQ